MHFNLDDLFLGEPQPKKEPTLEDQIARLRTQIKTNQKFIWVYRHTYRTQSREAMMSNRYLRKLIKKIEEQR